jgi:hypothetical protein
MSDTWGSVNPDQNQDPSFDDQNYKNRKTEKNVSTITTYLFSSIHE